MRLEQRERVDGTQITIGHRVQTSKGVTKVSRRYTAEYRDDSGRQRSEALGTTNRVQARRRALEIQQRLDAGEDKPKAVSITMGDLAERYLQSVHARDVAPKTLAKYRADIAKLLAYCTERRITLARRFMPDDLYAYRQWLMDQGFAPKTVDGALTLTKQIFKWAWRQQLLRDFRLAAVSLPKARARPQPCFTTEQVERLIAVARGHDPVAFALMGYAGLRIGEVEQLRWEDVRFTNELPTMLHIRRGGGRDTTKDKDDRFVPVHPRVAALLPTPKSQGVILSRVAARPLLKRLKRYCSACDFDRPEQFKLHSFRHHFASLCANHHVAHRKALAWLGHSSSQMLDLYYHLHDDDSQQAMHALANATPKPNAGIEVKSRNEGVLKAKQQSKIEKLMQVHEFQEFVDVLYEKTERGGFEPPVRV